MFGLPFYEPAYYLFNVLEGKNKNRADKSAEGVSEKK